MLFSFYISFFGLYFVGENAKLVEDVLSHLSHLSETALFSCVAIRWYDYDSCCLTNEVFG
jgi:hypothetical protein